MAVGTQIGTYEIREQVGSGGMATVYRGYQPSMERFVAIKVIHPSILADKTLRDRFQREARLIAKLEHPHLLPIYEFDSEHETPYIVMRFLEGGTLKQVLAEGRLPHAEIVYMLRQVASALDYAHRQGIVHRDLKPSNIMIDREGNAFIADFGIARISDGQEDLTGTGVLIGTPGYMAPEQARGENTIDHRADLYSLGATLFEMLTGEPPYRSESNLGVIMAHVNEPVPSIVERNAQLPVSLQPVIDRALAKRPKDRYPTAAALVDALSLALEVKEGGVPAQLQSMTETISLQQLKAFETERRARSTGTSETPSDQQRQMTTVYLDVTEVSDHLYESGKETETVRSIMDPLWNRFETIATKYGGVIQSRTDEMGVALWGLERAREDDSEQAIRAALEMREETERLARRSFGPGWEPSEESPLPFRAGITTGPVLLERTGDTSSYTATGATITLAGRLKEAAPSGSILVDHDSWTQVRGVFSFYEHEPVRVRGRKEPIEVYLAVSARPRAFRMQARGIEGVETKMIGREIELRLLQEALTLTVEDGETQVVTVVGDAGVGKSRLLYEFTNWVDLIEESFWFFEARATQPSMLQPYSMTRDLFSFRFQILDSDPLEVVHEKFIGGIKSFLGEKSEDQAVLIGQLVGFDFSSHPTVSGALQDPESFQRQALAHLGNFFITASGEHPIFIQIEDIHWADDRSLDLINNLVRENTQIPLFVICMARPSLFERRPQWGEGQRFHARVALEPLSLLSSRRLVKELLKLTEQVPTQLRDLIIDRAEGNPFYIEELIKALIDDKVILKGEEKWRVDDTRLSSVRIPPTLTGLLQSRLDTLPPGLQQLLQRASVVGRVFWDSAVMHLSVADGLTPNAVSQMLADLREREMILLREETSFEGASEYVFRHAISRDVTYQTVVPRQRRTYHKLVADWLLDIGAERENELRSLVAKHYELAGEVSKAALHLSEAGKDALRTASHEQAVEAYEMAIRILEEDEHRHQRSLIVIQLSEAHALRSNYERARLLLEPVIEDARARGDKEIVAKAGTQLGRLHTIWLGETEKGVEYVEEALPLAKEIEDHESVLTLLRMLGTTYYIKGDPKAETYLRESLELARKLDDGLGQATALNTLGNWYGHTREFEKAIACYEEAMEHFREAERAYGIAMVNANFADVGQRMGDDEIAIRGLQEGLPIAKEVGNNSMILGFESLWALYHVRHDELDKAKPLILDSLSRALQSDDPRDSIYALDAIVAYYGRTGRPERALELGSFASAHPATDVPFADMMRERIALFRNDLSDEAADAAIERGRTLDRIPLLEQIKQEFSS